MSTIFRSTLFSVDLIDKILFFLVKKLDQHIRSTFKLGQLSIKLDRQVIRAQKILR
jgi:hypothetical protein